MKKILIILTIIIVSISIYIINVKNIPNNILNQVETEEVNISKYYIYGTHFNLEGTLNTTDNIENAYIVLKNTEEELTYNINITKSDNKITFKTSELINEGISLEEIKLGNYLILLKTTTNNQIKYYTLNNNTKYNNVTYYTITKNNQNNIINIEFNNQNDKNYLNINVNKNNNPDYYDIAIDPGHGGNDPGANYKKYTEAAINLEYAISLKQTLENLGLKVILTRNEDTKVNSYGPNSRVTIPHEAKAKYVFSIHLNSCENITSGGVEIYAPTNASLDLAKKISNNITTIAKTNYSKNESFKKDNGVYVRTFTKDDINEAITEAKKNNYNPYQIDTTTNYYFIIRETGGIATNAYVDGRNKSVPKNDYYNTNIGIEGYLLELGYINYQSDLNNLIQNKEKYVEGIAKAIKDELNI